MDPKPLALHLLQMFGFSCELVLPNINYHRVIRLRNWIMHSYEEMELDEA